MSTITKERVTNLLQFNSEGGDCQANAEQWEVHELARIALASLEAEPVAYMTYKGYLLHAADPKLAEYSESTPLYDAPPAVPEEMPKGLAGQIVSLLAHNIGDKLLAQKIWNACRAAMLNQEKSNG